MLRQMRQVFAVFLVAGLAFAPVAQAQDINQKYSIYVGGIKLGGMALTGRERDRNYKVSVSVKGEGILSRLVKFSFSGSSEGTVDGVGKPVPTLFRSYNERKGVTRETKMTYRGGEPRTINWAPNRTRKPFDARAAEQAGTLDPIAAAYFLLKDAPVGQACGKTVQVFDGARRSQVEVKERKQQKGKWICEGVYTRLQGWSADDLAEKRRFPFRLVFRERDGVMVLERFQTESLYGLMAAIRR